jgi:hypothetical protein
MGEEEVAECGHWKSVAGAHSRGALYLPSRKFGVIHGWDSVLGVLAEVAVMESLEERHHRYLAVGTAKCHEVSVGLYLKLDESLLPG